MHPEDPSHPISDLLYSLQNLFVLTFRVELFRAQGRDLSFVADQISELI